MILIKRNVLVNAAGRACLSHIGFAAEKLEADGTGGDASIPQWTAPEIFKNGKFSKPSDVFSFAFVAAEVCTRNATSYGRNKLCLDTRRRVLLGGSKV